MSKKVISITIGMVFLLILIFIGIYFVGFTQQSTVFFSSTYPVRAVSVVESRASCNPDSPYDKVLLPYYQKVKVRTINNQDQATSTADSSGFMWDIGLRTSSERYSKVEIDGGIPPHILCDTQKPLCAYESGCPKTLERACPRIDGTDWEYNSGDDLCYPQIVVSQPISPSPSGWDKFLGSIRDIFCRILPFFCK